MQERVTKFNIFITFNASFFLGGLWIKVSCSKISEIGKIDVKFHLRASRARWRMVKD